MENASKALIIAGAILISIILISVGIMVVQSAGGVVGGGTAQMDAQEKQVFNERFLNYAGSQKGSTVRTLINSVISNNATYKDEADKQIKVNGSEAADAISAELNNIKATKTYTVTVTVSPDTGLVSDVSYSG